MTKQLDFTKLDLHGRARSRHPHRAGGHGAYEELTAVMREASHRGGRVLLSLHGSEGRGKAGADLPASRKKLFGKTARRIERALLWDVEAPGYETVHDFMTLREALKVAMEAEVKAYHYFNEALKLPLAPPVKKLFEELRQEEIAHQEDVGREFAKAPAGGGGDARGLRRRAGGPVEGWGSDLEQRSGQLLERLDVARARALTTSGGRTGAGGVLFQPVLSRKSRTNCLSKHGCEPPGLHVSFGQKREESGVSASSIQTSRPVRPGRTRTSCRRGGCPAPRRRRGAAGRARA